MDVLLSIKPKYVNKIMEGKKEFEFRKTKLKKEKIENIYVYSTSPVKKIIAKITIEDIIEDSPDAIWNKCKNKSGVTKEEFYSYFNDKKIAFAIHIKEIEMLKKPIHCH